MMKEDDDVEDNVIPQSQDPSFLRRLAGASAHKAGLALDQTEINRRIAEASKGSKFYENEKRREADWTERINALLAKREELYRQADIGRVEAKVDRIFAELEAKRDLSQTIVHIDMDAFYANVELLRRPELKDKPFVVCGLGIITTASYEARKFGVRSGQAEHIGKKLCPELIFVPVDYHRVNEFSQKIMDVCKEYHPDMYIAGCDEGYLNITQYLNDHNIDADTCVQEIRRRIFEETKLTASAGIAPNMMLAKICSDKNKPNSQFHLLFTRDAVMEFVRDLPVRKVPGIGRVAERVLESLGIKTCGDIYKERAFIWLMPRRFDVDFLFKTHLGISTNNVRPAQREERKSVGASRTFKAVSTKEAILKKLEYIASLLEHDLRVGGYEGKLVTLTYKEHTFRVHTRQVKLERWVSKKEDLFQIGKELIKPVLPSLKVRLLGLRVGDLNDLRAPRDQGIKKYFESTGSPSKKKRKLSHSGREGSEAPSGVGTLEKPFVIDDEDVVKEELGEEDTSFVGGDNDNDGDGVDMDDDEEGLEGDADESGEKVDFSSRFTSMKDSFMSDDKELMKKEHDIPMFHARRPPHCPSNLIKVGNDKAAIIKLKTNKPLKPISVIQRQTPPPPLPQRSKSEQPRTSSRSTTPVGDNDDKKSVKLTNSNITSSTRGSQHKQGNKGTGTLSFPVVKKPRQSGSSSQGDKPNPSGSVTANVPVRELIELLICPICSREMYMNNTQLNEHIDYCLSRTTIIEATGDAS